MLNLDSLLESLKELSSKEDQKKLWLHGDKNNMSSFTEAICCIFDDAGLTRAMESDYLKNNFSRDLCQKVERLNCAIDLVSDDLTPSELIECPEMNRIRVLSQELLEMFEVERKLLESN